MLHSTSTAFDSLIDSFECRAVAPGVRATHVTRKPALARTFMYYDPLYFRPHQRLHVLLLLIMNASSAVLRARVGTVPYRPLVHESAGTPNRGMTETQATPNTLLRAIANGPSPPSQIRA